MNNQNSLPYAIYDTNDPVLPTMHEIGDALGQWKPYSSELVSSIWSALRTVKKYGHHRLIVTILSMPPKGSRCICSKLDKGYRIEAGILYGIQRIDICPNSENCRGRTDTRICENIHSSFKHNDGICKKGAK